MLSLLFLSLTALANPTPAETGCLQSLAEFEYGKGSQFNNMAIAVRYPDKPRGSTYAWDGNRIWLVNKKSGVVKGVPINKATDSAVYLDNSGKTEVWSAENYKKTGDGRTRPAFSGDDLSAITRLFLKQTFTDFYFHKSMGGVMRGKVAAACENVSTVQINIKPSDMISIADAVKHLKSEYPK